jgi:hypothetical protein
MYCKYDQVLDLSIDADDKINTQRESIGHGGHETMTIK